jgi:hypothetical protein
LCLSIEHLGWTATIQFLYLRISVCCSILVFGDGGKQAELDSIAAMATLQEIVHDYVSRHVNLDAPDWYINPNFKLLNSPDAADIRAATPLTFAPGLLDVVQSDRPPSVDFFASLPVPEGRFWAVYVVLLVKDGSEPAIYVGSGTDAIHGYRTRVATYPNKTHRMLPRFVRRLYDQGYDFAHVGLLCWSPIPSAAIVPRARLRILSVEAVFTNLFYSALPTCMDELWTNFMPWSRGAVSWLPLNSHSPFREACTGDLALTAVELLQHKEDLKRRAKQHSKKAYAKNAQRMRDQYDLDRAQDIDAFRAKKRAQAISWTARNKPRVLAAYARTKKKAVVECRFYCTTCQKAFRDSNKLKRHNGTLRHRNKVVGHGPTAKMLSDRASSARIRARKTHHCATCNQTFDSAYHLAAHKLTNKHLARSTS